MAIKTYKKGDNQKIATNFTAREFDCQGAGCCSATLVDEKLVEHLQKIRDHFGKPVYLTAYRCKTHNARTPNAAPNSYHVYGHRTRDRHSASIPHCPLRGTEPQQQQHAHSRGP